MADSAMTPSRAAEIRAQQGCPTIDCDGHIVEHGPLFLDYVREVGGKDCLAAYQKYAPQILAHGWYGTSQQEKEQFRVSRPPFWARPARNTLDRATAMYPDLRRERMDAFGIDFAILYPTLGLTWVEEPNDDFRAVFCRAYNTMVRDLFAEHSDRMTPVAIIPTYTPEEAINELEYAVGTLGLKSIMICTQVNRPVAAAANAPDGVQRFATWMDPLALDSAYDYDPFWAKCVDLGVAVTGHNLIFGKGSRQSISNFMYNHCGHFAEGAHTFSKALFFGGVTHRFPGLNFAFLEGGASWACDLYNGLVSRWKKRGLAGMATYDPRSLDVAELERLRAEYGGALINKAGAADTETYIGFGDNSLELVRDLDLANLDDFAAASIEQPEQIFDDHFARFYIGCEADDPFVGTAMDGKRLPYNRKIKAVFGSDQGHWDVVEMVGVLEEAYEGVEDGILDEADYRDFVFSNPALLHAEMNPDFFKGTIVEDDVARLVGNRG